MPVADHFVLPGPSGGQQRRSRRAASPGLRKSRTGRAPEVENDRATLDHNPGPMTKVFNLNGRKGAKVPNQDTERPGGAEGARARLSARPVCFCTERVVMSDH